MLRFLVLLTLTRAAMGINCYASSSSTWKNGVCTGATYCKAEWNNYQNPKIWELGSAFCVKSSYKSEQTGHAKWSNFGSASNLNCYTDMCNSPKNRPPSNMPTFTPSTYPTNLPQTKCFTNRNSAVGNRARGSSGSSWPTPSPYCTGNTCYIGDFNILGYKDSVNTYCQKYVGSILGGQAGGKYCKSQTSWSYQSSNFKSLDCYCRGTTLCNNPAFLQNGKNQLYNMKTGVKCYNTSNTMLNADYCSISYQVVPSGNKRYIAYETISYTSNALSLLPKEYGCRSFYGSGYETSKTCNCNTDYCNKVPNEEPTKEDKVMHWLDNFSVYGKKGSKPA